MKRLLLIMALLATPVYAQVHDCRIANIDIKSVRSGPDLVLIVAYYGFDGGSLSLTLCPDQHGPTWGSEADVVLELTSANRAVLRDAERGRVYWFSVATNQEPDRTFYRERRIRF